MTNSPSNKRKSTVLPRSTVDYLKNWMMSPEHIAHPYPTEKEKSEIMAATDIELKQLTNWFVNNRKRFWKPRVEARLQQQIQAQTTAPSMASRPQSIGSSLFRPQQSSSPITFNGPRTNTNNTIPSSETRNFAPDQCSFQIITNHHTFVPPDASESSANNDSQVVSMGSSSYASDSDSSSICNSSNDGNDVFHKSTDTFENCPTENILATNKSEVIVENSITHTLSDDDRQVVSPCRDFMQSPVKSIKRNRSKGDLLSFSSPRTIIVRPRSLTFNSATSSIMEPVQKRKCLEDWSSACRNARHGYDNSLPSLEEATNLFGFSAGN